MTIEQLKTELAAIETLVNQWMEHGPYKNETIEHIATAKQLADHIANRLATYEQTKRVMR